MIFWPKTISVVALRRIIRMSEGFNGGGQGLSRCSIMPLIFFVHSDFHFQNLQSPLPKVRIGYSLSFSSLHTYLLGNCEEQYFLMLAIHFFIAKAPVYSRDVQSSIVIVVTSRARHANFNTREYFEPFPIFRPI